VEKLRILGAADVWFAVTNPLLVVGRVKTAWHIMPSRQASVISDLAFKPTVANDSYIDMFKNSQVLPRGL